MIRRSRIVLRSKKTNIPKSVEHIGCYAFYDCTRLLSIDIPENIQSIGMETFSGCTRLASVTLYRALTVIEQMAFAFCPLIEKIYYCGSESDWKNIKIDQYNGLPYHSEFTLL